MNGFQEKMWYIHTMDCYSAMQKEDILPFAKTGMDLEDISSESKRETSYDFAYIWKLKKQMDKQNKTGTVTDTENNR